MPDLNRILAAREPLTLASLPRGSLPLVLSDLARAAKRRAVFIAPDDAAMRAAAEAARFFAPEIEVIAFPAWDCLPYDRLSPTAGIAAQRMATLTRLAQRKPGEGPVLVVTTVGAAMQRTPPRSVTTQAGFETRVGRDLDIQALERYFAANGYVRASTVSERGEFAVRGGVVEGGSALIEIREIGTHGTS